MINQTSKQMEEQGKKIFKFGFGQSPFSVPQDVVQELKNNAYQNKYLPMQGLSELRKAVSKYTSQKKKLTRRDDSTTVAGGERAGYFFSRALFHAGDGADAGDVRVDISLTDVRHPRRSKAAYP